MKLDEYQKQTEAIRKRAEKLQRSIHDRGWALAESVGISRCGCSLHNASIDDHMAGWCARNPQRLRAAKIAVRIVTDWSASNLASRIISRIYNRFASEAGWRQSDPLPLSDGANHHLLFAPVARLKGDK